MDVKFDKKYTNERRLIMLTGIFVAIVVMSDFLAVKLFQVGVFHVPVSVIIFPLCFAVMDVVCEEWSIKTAMSVLISALAIKTVVAVFSILSVIIPASPFGATYREYSAVFMQMPRILFGSIVAVAASMLLSIFLHKIMKEKAPKIPQWARCLICPFAALIADSFLFIIIAYAGADGFSAANLFLSIAGNIIGKACVVFAVGAPLAIITILYFEKHREATHRMGAPVRRIIEEDVKIQHSAENSEDDEEGEDE